MKDCWSFWNGINLWGVSPFNGDGNGFKLGHGGGAHVLIRCVAYDHPHHGIDVNGNETGVLVYNCTCVMNGGANLFFDDPRDTHMLRNNLSYLFWEYVVPEVDDQYNSWNGFTVGSGDFESLDPTGIDGQREADGGLPKLSFLRLSTRSPLIDAGIHMGLPFQGDAPDLGAFEHLEGDSEPDGDVDLYDLERLASNWLYINCGDCNGADFDGNGKVDLYDFGKLAGNWLKY